MSEPQQSVRMFVEDSYQMVSSNTPTVPLHGNNLSKGISILNMLLNQYSATGLMITVPKQVDIIVHKGQGVVTFGQSDYVADPFIPPYPIPAPNPPIYAIPPIPLITYPGRLVNLENAWV